MEENREQALQHEQRLLDAIIQSTPDFPTLPFFKKCRCGYNRHGQLVSLDLSDLAFPALPPKLFQLRNLRVLKLRGLQLRVLPPDLFQLHTLKVLDLSDNHLRTIPPEIEQLQRLEKLHILWNRLQELPAEIGQLQHLQKLNLVGNQLRQVPPTLGSLHHLQKLDLSRNLLSTIPAELAQLHCLRDLLLRDNLLDDVPVALRQMRTLRRLDLTRTHYFEDHHDIFEDIDTFLSRLDRLEQLITLAQQHSLSDEEQANVRRAEHLLGLIRESMWAGEVGKRQDGLGVVQTVARWQEVKRCLAYPPFPALAEHTPSSFRE